jgi:hypothetical protein
VLRYLICGAVALCFGILMWGEWAAVCPHMRKRGPQTVGCWLVVIVGGGGMMVFSLLGIVVLFCEKLLF